MAQTTMRDKLKLLLGIGGTDKDALLDAVIDMAGDDFLAMSNADDAEIPAAAESLILKMACVKYNTLGNEGLASQSYNGVSESYEGYGDDIMLALQRFKRCRTV